MLCLYSPFRLALEIRKEISLGAALQSHDGAKKFTAEKNKGAFLNGKQISVSNKEFLKDGLLVTGFPYGSKDNVDHCIDHFA